MKFFLLLFMCQRCSRMISLAKSMRDDVEEAVQQVHQLLEIQSKVILGTKDFRRVPEKNFF